MVIKYNRFNRARTPWVLLRRVQTYGDELSPTIIVNPDTVAHVGGYNCEPHHAVVTFTDRIAVEVHGSPDEVRQTLGGFYSHEVEASFQEPTEEERAFYLKEEARVLAEYIEVLTYPVQQDFLDAIENGKKAPKYPKVEPPALIEIQCVKGPCPSLSACAQVQECLAAAEPE